MGEEEEGETERERGREREREKGQATGQPRDFLHKGFWDRMDKTA